MGIWAGERTTTDTLALALTGAAGTVAAVVGIEEQPGTGREENWDCELQAFNLIRVGFVATYHPASWGNL